MPWIQPLLLIWISIILYADFTLCAVVTLWVATTGNGLETELDIRVCLYFGHSEAHAPCTRYPDPPDTQHLGHTSQSRTPNTASPAHAFHLGRVSAARVSEIRSSPTCVWPEVSWRKAERRETKHGTCEIILLIAYCAPWWMV